MHTTISFNVFSNFSDLQQTFLRTNLITHAIDFTINGLSTENRLRSQRTPTPYTKLKLVNNCKLRDLVIRIELTLAILMPRFSNFLRYSEIHFRTLFYLVICFMRVTVSWLCRHLQAVSKIHVTINLPCLICEWRRNCSTMWLAQQRNHDSQETHMKIWENGWSNFSENLRIVALKLLE